MPSVSLLLEELLIAATYVTFYYWVLKALQCSTSSIPFLAKGMVGSGLAVGAFGLVALPV